MLDMDTSLLKDNYFFLLKTDCFLIKYITTTVSPPFTSHEVLSWAWNMHSQWNSELVLKNYEMTFHFNFSSQSLQKIAKCRRENYVKGWWECLNMVSQKDDLLFLFWDLQHSRVHLHCLRSSANLKRGGVVTPCEGVMCFLVLTRN